MKRLIGSTVAVLGLAAGSLLVATPAQASAPCDAFYRDTARSGFMYAWNLPHCSGLMGGTQGNDANWGDSSGAFTNNETNNAESVMNKGTGSSYHIVRFYDYTAHSADNGYGCLSPGELYADDLRDNKLHDGGPAANSISSHNWVSSCSWWVD
ncbi:hypothetical protein [Streptomyces sp. SJL17-1]|uniref:hypothetical protein n=1 Tax=Streptomyces sp. SJL17-1 TaxID=2967223 RepID=UPI0029673AC6|nr:hypothetical protein [Streptomyces sp. SJL17-1]